MKPHPQVPKCDKLSSNPASHSGPFKLAQVTEHGLITGECQWIATTEKAKERRASAINLN
jgi:hypothetical protein